MFSCELCEIFKNIFFLRRITKPCTHLHSAPSISTYLISACTQPLQHPQRYYNQNIARDWTIFPNLGKKIQSCPFRLKTGTHRILELLIPSPSLDFWNSDPKIHFWENLGQESQSCPKMGTYGISRMMILIPTLVFWISNPKSIFWQIWAKKVSSPFCLKTGTHGIVRMLILIPPLVFWISKPKSTFGHISVKNVKVV